MEPAQYSDDALTDAIRERESALRAVLSDQLRLIAEAHRRELHVAAGTRNPQVWLRELLNLPAAEAKTRVMIATATTETTGPTGQPLPARHPILGDSVHNGRITSTHARIILDGLDALPPHLDDMQRERIERELTDHARIFSPHQVRTLAERIRYALDQDGALSDEGYQVDHRELHIGIGRDNMTVLNGRLDRETGEKLRVLLEPLAAPRPQAGDSQIGDPQAGDPQAGDSQADGPGIDGSAAPGAATGPGTGGTRDPRTTGKRNADAFADLLDLFPANATGDQDPMARPEIMARPQITVTINYDELLERFPGDTGKAGGTLGVSGQPITAAHVRRLACDADILPIVMGGDSLPLDVGRARRTAPRHLRAALLARDGQCSFPGCDPPPGRSEAHHIVGWAQGGATDLSNLVMLCARHHRIVHSHHWDIELSAGRPVFVPPRWIDPARTPRPGGKPVHQDAFDLASP